MGDRARPLARPGLEQPYSHSGSRRPTRIRRIPGERPFAFPIPLAVELLDLPADTAFVLLGWSSAMPTPLGALGMPGCTQHVSADAVTFVSGRNGAATFRLPIPDTLALVGLRFHNQALVIDPGAGNALGAVVSEAAVGVVGR